MYKAVYSNEKWTKTETEGNFWFQAPISIPNIYRIDNAE